MKLLLAGKDREKGGQMIKLQRTYNEKSGAELFSRHNNEIRDYEGNVESKKEEGFFITEEELRECFEAGMNTEANPHDYPDFKQWLSNLVDEFLSSHKEKGD